jgi:RNA polymerase sigma-70 factor, ECF subfamily
VRTAYWGRNRLEGKGKIIISVRERKLLLLRAQTGDAEALNTLFESCRKRLYCQAMRMLARPQDAEDVVQEAMLAAFRHLDQFQGRADFLTWATRIVINAALQHIRKARAKQTVPWDHVHNEFEDGPYSEYSKDPQPTPEEHLRGLECREILEDALRKLPRDTRRAIQLCKLGDCSLKEAASALGLRTTTLKVRLHRGRRALMAHLKKKTQVRRKPSANKLWTKVLVT